MKVSCLQENLAKGLSIVGRAVGTRSTLPVLSNVLLKTDGGRLKLAATNLEIVIVCWVGAKVEEEGAITVPARTLTDLVGAMPKDRVEMTLSTESKTLHLACARTEANVKGLDAAEFPLIPEVDGNDRLEIKGDVLRSMINQVAFSAATADARPTLTGVETRIDGKEIRMAATDGFRLSIKKATFEGVGLEAFSAIIPARALTELARIVDDESEMVSVSMPEGRNQVIFDIGSVLLVTQLIDGAFPDYNPIIPTGYKTRTTLSSAELAQACRMAEIFAREANHTTRIKITPGDELMPGYATISAVSAETGDNVAQIDATVEGEEIEIAFNVRLLNQVLGVIEAPQIVLETTQSTAPGLIRAAGDDDFKHIIMPMHFGR